MSKAADLARTASASETALGSRNKVINGAMTLDQRNAGTVTVNSTVYTIDRWQANQTTAGKFSVGKSTTAPTGFTNSYLATSLSAYSVLSSDIFFFQQNIEGNNVANLAWGTASAKTITLSFWVRSSLTGTFGGSLANAAHNRSYPFSYTISTADAFEYKTVTITGDTAGTWATDNTTGMQVIFGIGGGASRSGTAGSWQAATLYTATGATSVVGTSGATFYITGVQLESGTVATPFEHRSYGEELALCQRYYQTGVADFRSGSSGAESFVSSTKFIREMRAIPTTAYTAAAAATANVSGTPSLAALSTNTLRLTVYSAAGGDVYYVRNFSLSAEL